MFVDIGIAVIVLIGFLIGLKRGFGKSFLKFLSICGSLILTWRLTPYAMKFILEKDFFNQLVYGEGISLTVLFGWIKNYNSSENSVILNAILNPLVEYATGAGVAAENVGQYMPYLLAVCSATIIISLIVYLVVRLLIMVIVAIIKSIFIKYQPTRLSRVFGGIFEMINAAIFVLVLFMISSSVVGIPDIVNPVVKQTKDSYVVNYTYNFVMENYSKCMIQDTYLKSAIEQAEKKLAKAQ